MGMFEGFVMGMFAGYIWECLQGIYKNVKAIFWNV